MDKKKIFAIAIFFLMGFFVFTFANPSENKNAKEKVKDTTSKTEEVVQNTNTTNDNVGTPTLAMATPIVANVAAQNVGEGTTGPVVNPTQPDIINDVDNVVDIAKPVIELIGGDVVLRIGDEYQELGAVATDDVDGNITDSIIISGEVKDEKGKYTITYNVKDQAGNSADPVTRTVYVVDTKDLENAIKEGNTILDNDNTTKNEVLLSLLNDLTEEEVVANNVLEDETSLQDVIDGETTNLNEIINKIKNLEFRVSFVDYNDSEISVQTVKYYENAVVPETPTRKGYTFSKWNGKYTNIVDDEVVKASYTLDTYSITYSDSLNATNNNVTKYTVEKIELISDLEKLGYTFGGFTYNGKTVKSTEGYAEDLNLFVNWTINNYKITLDPDNGTTIDDINYTILTPVTLPTPEKDGYTFEGWYDGETKVTGVITGNYNLKAKYSVNNYTITYVDELNVENTNETSYNVESNVTINDLSKTGYTFNGWYDGETKVTSTEGYTENLTLTASWTLNEYEITYNLNGGTLKNQNITKYTVNTVFTLNNPSKEDYTFDGWYNGETKVTKIENMTGKLELNAVYTPNQTGINAELKINTFLQFNKGDDVDNESVKNYINVYPVYADGSIGENPLANSEYEITGFTTEKEIASAELVVKQGDFEDTLNYSIVSSEAVQTKFEVIYQANSYLASSSYCTDWHCDKNEWRNYYLNPTSKRVNKPILEIIEHYDQYIKVNNVTANYGENNNVDLNRTNTIRWSHKTYHGNGTVDIWNPVKIASIGVLNSDNMKDIDITNLKTVTISYSRTFKERKKVKHGWGWRYEYVDVTKNYVVVFENRNGIFVAISEYEVTA